MAQLQILLAEDNYPDALLARSALRIAGLPVEVHIVSDGEKAIDFIAAAEKDPAAPVPQVFLLDINLPRATGFEVLRHLRARDRWRTTPVLMFSGSDADADRAEATRLGASYFKKPDNYGGFLKLGDVLKQFLADNNLV